MKKLLLIIINFTIYCNYAFGSHCSMMSAETKRILCNDPHLMDYKTPIIITIILIFFLIIYNVNANKKNSIKTKKEKEMQRKAEEKEIQYYKKIDEEEKRLAREERKIDKEVSSSDLGASLKRLKKMYNDGHLSKPEFEKAKNKLLK